jgi:hypothetical protein
VCLLCESLALADAPSSRRVYVLTNHSVIEYEVDGGFEHDTRTIPLSSLTALMTSTVSLELVLKVRSDRDVFVVFDSEVARQYFMTVLQRAVKTQSAAPIAFASTTSPLYAHAKTTAAAVSAAARAAIAGASTSCRHAGMSRNLQRGHWSCCGRGMLDACSRAAAASTSTTQSPCPPGTFGATTGLGSAACSGQCPPAYFCPAQSLSPTANICPAGVYGASAGLGSAACSGTCPLAYFCTEGTVAPAPCPGAPGCTLVPSQDYDTGFVGKVVAAHGHATQIRRRQR